MSAEVLEILEPGLITTVQDRGRYGYQRFGVPVSGAMDLFALRAANILVGNDQGTACLEMTALGTKVRFLDDALIAITGADLAPVVDGEPMPRWQSVKVGKGSVLGSEGGREGLFSYLAIAGGIDVPKVMGSRSTYLNGAIGGLEGRGLKAGDVLGTLELEPNNKLMERSLPDDLVPPTFGEHQEIRVILGPEDDAFTAGAIATFLGSAYTVSIESDRMGYRLDGPVIEHVSGPDIVSDGSSLGAVQVPGDGRPIVLLADRGPTGGYTKIATVISTDIGKLAQSMPGVTIAFKAVTLEEAHSILREQEAIIETIKGSARSDPRHGLSIVVDGEPYEVLDEAGEAVALPELSASPVSHQTHRVKTRIDGRTFEFEVEVQEVE